MTESTDNSGNDTVSNETKVEESEPSAEELKQLLEKNKEENDRLRKQIKQGVSRSIVVLGVVLVIVLGASIVYWLVSKQEIAIYASGFLLLAGVLVLMWTLTPVDDRLDMEAIQLLRIKASLGIVALITIWGVAAMTVIGGDRNEGKTGYHPVSASRSNAAQQPTMITTPSCVSCVLATVTPGVDCNQGKNGHDSAATDKSNEAQQPSATNTLPSVSPQETPADQAKTTK